MSAVIMTLKEAARFMEATKGLEGDDLLMWWRENHKYRAALRQALENYEKAKAYAAEHAEEILEADANGAWHLGRELMLDAHKKLTDLGLQNLH